MHLFFGLENGGGEFLRVLQRQAQHMKGKPLGRLAADPRQPCELVCQILKRSGEKLHDNPSFVGS